MKARIEIIITEDQKLFRQSLIPLLEEENIYTIGEASNGKELLHLLEVEQLKPGIILLDLEMPEMDGSATLSVLREKFPGLKVIILSTFHEGSLLNTFKAKGASAYLTKNTDIDIVAETIRNVHYLEGYSNIRSTARSLFTKGELQVIPLVLSGKTSKQIGELLKLSEKTVESYRRKLYLKTHTANASEFSGYCTRHGLSYIGNGRQAAENAPK